MNLIVWLFRPILSRITQMEYRIMAKIDDATARLEAAGTANTDALTSLITAANLEIKQVADALAGSGSPDTDALADRLNAVGDALDQAVQAANAAKASLDADDPAPPAAPAV